MFLSIIIPAYNEEKRIGPTLESIFSYLKKKNYSWEIIVVANNCQDNTDEVVKNYQKTIPNLKLIDIQDSCGGKGCAVKIGMEKGLGDYLLFMDADNSTKIREFDRFLPHLESGFDVVIGSRAMPGAKVVIGQSFYREIFGRLANLLIQIILLPGIRDTQCGFKAFRREAALRIFKKQKIVAWGFDIEVLALARHLGYKIKEAPIVWYNAPESKVSFLNYFSTFWELLRIRWNLYKERYNEK